MFEKAPAELRTQRPETDFRELDRFILHRAVASDLVRIRSQSHGRFEVRAVEVDYDFVYQGKVSITQHPLHAALAHPTERV